MPGGDRTGPMGMGAMTGGARGYCAGFQTPGYGNRWFGFGRLGLGRGMGMGKGFRWRQLASGTAPVQRNAKTEADFLKNQANMLQQEMDALNKRIAQIESQDEA